MKNDELLLKSLRLIDAHPSSSQRQIARNPDMSLGDVNHCMKSLAEINGMRDGNSARSNHKLSYLCVLTLIGIKQRGRITSEFLGKKRIEYEMLSEDIGIWGANCLKT